MAAELKRFVDQAPNPGEMRFTLSRDEVPRLDKAMQKRIMMMGLGRVHILDDVVLNDELVTWILTLETTGWAIFATKDHFHQLGPHPVFGRLW